VLDHDLIQETPDTRTWARVTTFESESSERVEDALRKVVDHVTPLVRELPGWKGTLALATENRRRGLVVTFWDSVEHMVASGRTTAELRADADVVAGIERLEIVHEERPE
jgi:heme-degrading monooxygenase HmoA